VYFNELVGGPRGAFARYDMDYWGNCMFQALAWSAETARLSGTRIAMSASSDPTQLVKMQVGRFPASLYWSPPEQSELSIRLNRGSAQSVSEVASRRDLVHTVRTPDGAVLCAVEPGPRFDQVRAQITLASDRFPYPSIWR